MNYQILYKNDEKVFTDYKHTYEVYLRKTSEGKYPIYFNKGDLAGKKYFINVFKNLPSEYEILTHDSSKVHYIEFTMYDDNGKSFSSSCYAKTNNNDPSFYSDSTFYEWLYDFIDLYLSEH